MGGMSDGLVMRGGTWQMRRAVPRRYAAVESRKEIIKSMRTDSRSEAMRIADDYWERLEAGWQMKLAGNDPGTLIGFDAAQRIAARKGHRYVTMDELVAGPLQDLLGRVASISVEKGRPDKAEAAALLGAVPTPVIKLSDALDEFWKLSVEDRKGKSDDQIRRWWNPVKKAINNLISVVGDKPMDLLSRNDMLDFRDWWEQRLEVENKTANSANKDLIYVGKVLKRINARKRLGLDLPLGELMFREGEQRKRPAFSDTWVADRLMAPGALDGLNPEARAIMLVMINTGARPSEIAELRPEQIKLDDAVPHIRIRAVGRTLKSRRAKRDLPLTGVSLRAMRDFPNGFPRYQANSAGLSAAINKFMRANGLLETDRHTLYSLRHSMMNRMIVNGVDDRIRRDVMGHTLTTEEYGDAGGVAYIAEVLTPFAL